jgi:tetratricopeptide (TPR) repeat protein
MFLVFSQSTSGTAEVQTDSIPDELQMAYVAMMDLKLDSAREFQMHFKRTASSHPFELYLENFCTIIDLYLNGSEIEYKENKKIEDAMLDRISHMDDSVSYKHFLKTEIKLQWALIKLKFDSDFQAMWSLRQAWSAAKKGHEMFPEFKPLWKAYGLLNVAFGTIPEKYQWIAGLFGLKGDVDEGLRYLNELYGSKHLMAVESGLLLALVHTYFYNDYAKSNKYILQLNSKIPESLLLVFLESSILMKESRSEDALGRLVVFNEKHSNGSTYTPLPYLHYMHGEILLQKGQYRQAIKSYQRFLQSHKGKNTVKDATFKISMCFWLMNDISNAEKQIKIAAVSGQTKNEVDKNADKIIRDGKMPNQVLLQIRYFTDGGYFDQADSVINVTRSNQFKNSKDRIEFSYRIARLNHKKGNIEAAKSGYHKVIDSQGTEPWYFAPNACLQMGYIYKSEKNSEHAISYFQQAMKYKNHQYVYSIRQKAKLELDELE